MSRKKRESQDPNATYQPSARELPVLKQHLARRDAATLAPRLSVLNDGKTTTISVNHRNRAVGYMLLMEALGTTDIDFANGLLRQLTANSVSQDEPTNENSLNFLLSIIKGIKPKDQLEAMLAAQMALVHDAAARVTLQLSHAKTLPEQDSAERVLNKLLRTFATQMETLKRYRTGGEQKVTVQHVSVSEGGQAIVGNVTQAARESTPPKPSSSTPALTNAQQPAMTIIDEATHAPAHSRRRRKDVRSPSA